MKAISRGFLLVEMVVALGIVALISGLLVLALRMNQQSWEVADAYLTTSNELRRGMQAISRELASANNASLNIPADGNWYPGLTFRVPEDLDGNGTVLDSNGVLELSSVIQYSLGGSDGAQIMRSQAGVTNRVLSDGVTSLLFRRQTANPRVVEISVAVQRQSGTGDFPNQATTATRIRVRN